MPQEIPNLAGVVSKDLVETIGTGSFKASYVNWSRTLNLLHEHASGWCVESVPAADGSLVHKAPGNGGYLLLRFRHIDGTVTPEVPQAIMDNRNNPIAYERISARDITDTHRRGACLAAAMTFGLAFELWAKLPLEAGYAADIQAEQPEATAQKNEAKPARSTAKKPSATKDQFLEAAIQKGLTTFAAEELASKLEGNYAGGIARLHEKNADWVEELNKSYSPKDNAEQW